MKAASGRNLVRVLLLVAVVGLSTFATAADDPAGEADSGWLDRTLRRYFVNDVPTGDELEGQALALVDRYRGQAGKIIEVIIVHQVDEFASDRDAAQGASSPLLTRLAQPFHTYTRDRIIRQYLLFERGQALDPFRLADSERLLRALDFINDVKIFVVPLEGADEGVAVVVESRDRWPFGAAGTTKGIDRFEAQIYNSNVAGIGIRFSNRLLYQGGAQPEFGYRGRLRKQNMAGSFITLALEYEDSWRELQRQVVAERRLAHPRIRWVGGLAWEANDDRDNGGVPRKFVLSDYWLGDVIQLSASGAGAGDARQVLVPAIRFARNDFSERPTVRPDTNQAYQNRRHYLGGLTYTRQKFYKTSYLYRMGETEDIPSGYAVKLSGGYEDGEFYGRTSAFTQAWLTSVRQRGDIVFVGVDLGGFYHNGKFEDGALVLETSYISPLIGGGAYKHRLFADLRYHRGIRRLDAGGLSLGDDSGLRSMENQRVLGDQRLVLKAESRTFTPWSVLGFRFMVFGFVDLGVVAAERAPLFAQKIYTSTGLGLRVNNPDLVFPTLQLRLAMLRSIDDNGLLFGFEIGGVDYPELRIPGTRPGGFEFR